MEEGSEAGFDENGGFSRFSPCTLTPKAVNPSLKSVKTVVKKSNIVMAKALTKSQITALIAEKHSLSKKQVGELLTTLAELAYKNAKNTFTLPGLGKLVLVNRKARMGRNPATGATIKIAAKRVVKFRVAKAAKDAILGKK